MSDDTCHVFLKEGFVVDGDDILPIVGCFDESGCYCDWRFAVEIEAGTPELGYIQVEIQRTEFQVQ